MLQYQIPQDVMIEDRIIGNVTFKQLGYLFFAFGICYIIYKKFAGNPFIWVPLCVFVWAIGAAFAFFKYHGMTLFQTIYYFIRYITFPTTRLWFQLSDFIDQNHVLIELQKESLKNIKKVDVGFKKDIYSNLDFISSNLDTGWQFSVLKMAEDIANKKERNEEDHSSLISTVLGENYNFQQHETRVDEMMQQSKTRFEEIKKQRIEEKREKEAIDVKGEGEISFE